MTNDFFGLTQRGIITLRSLLYRSEHGNLEYKKQVNSYIKIILENSIEPYWYGLPHFHDRCRSPKLIQAIQLYDEKYKNLFNETRLNDCKLKTNKSCAPAIIISVITSIYCLLKKSKYPVTYQKFNDKVFDKIKLYYKDDPNSNFKFDKNSFAVINKNGTPNLKKTLYVYLTGAFYCFSYFYDGFVLEKKSKANLAFISPSNRSARSGTRRRTPTPPSARSATRRRTPTPPSAHSATRRRTPTPPSAHSATRRRTPTPPSASRSRSGTRRRTPTPNSGLERPLIG